MVNPTPPSDTGDNSPPQCAFVSVFFSPFASVAIAALSYDREDYSVR